MLKTLHSFIGDSSKKKPIIDFGSYFFFNSLTKVLPFLLLPVLTRYLTPEEYGIVALYQVLISFFVPIIGMNMQVNITRNFFRKSQEDVAQIIFSICAILVTNFLIVTTLIIFVITLYPSLFDLPTILWLALPIIALMSMLELLNLTVLRNQKRAVLYGAFQVSLVSTNLIITLLLVVGFGLTWQGRIAGIIIATCLLGTLGFIRLIRSSFVLPKFSKQITINILRISVPLIPHAISMVIISLSDRLFLDQMLGKEAVAIYTIGYQFGMIVAITTDSFNQVWSPWMYAQLAKVTPKIKLQIVRYTYLYDVGIVLFAIIVTYTSYFLINFMTTADYADATQFVIWVALGYALRGMYMMRFPYLVHVGKTSFLAILTAVSAIVNLIANYILIQSNGSLGAAQATLLSFGIQLIGVWWYTNKIYKMPWFNIKELLKVKQNI